MEVNAKASRGKVRLDVRASGACSADLDVSAALDLAANIVSAAVDAERPARGDKTLGAGSMRRGEDY